ncbi:hypothetical protein OIE47_06735 [Micromonospora sp. NBC_01796]|nr:hypothetical protein OIE47_06735 [Micromonospora sp. NBC_01796]
MPGHRRTSKQGETARRKHLPLRPIWLCRTCGQPWPCGRAKLDLLAEYEGSRVGLCLYLATLLCDAIDDLHKLNPGTTGSGAGLFDRFLGWPRVPHPPAPNDHDDPIQEGEAGS